MQSNKKLLVLPGDGIGPEVVNEVLRVVDWLAKKRSVTFDVEEGLVGGAAYDAHGTPLTDETLADAVDADAVLFGSVGGPQYDDLPFEEKPERGLLRLRKEMDLFANLRPAMVFEAMAGSSTLKRDLVAGLDILILRELTGGIYFAQPRGIEDLGDGTKKGFDTNLYTTPEIERIGRVAIDLARKRRGKVTSVEKANVMMSGVLWRETMTTLFSAEAEDLETEHMYADNCGMQLVRYPKQFDVIVTDNLFGDMLSDCAAMLTGSLGMLPSASLGAVDEVTGKRHALYEPVHGSAPDIAGQKIANPIAELLSFSMALRYSFEMSDDADMIDGAIERVLASGIRTPDIMADGMVRVSTNVMMDSILRELDNVV
ncbi:MAG: 3-isopropylmalate dehydrogenase [Rhodospirillaceae bacterium]|nr:3-isopropylmalate dehydrogenase [Rhodospirillaceae bacterium]